MKLVFNNESKLEYIPQKPLSVKDNIVLKLNVKSTKRVRISACFFAGEKMVYKINQNFLPNYDVTVAFRVKELLGKNWFTMTYPGNFKGTTGGLPSDPSKVDRVEFFLSNAAPEDAVIYSLEVIDELPDFTVKGEPCVDRFGQYTGFEWEGKTHSEQELVEKLQKEYSFYEKNTEKVENIDKFGGFLGKKFEKKGYFYITNEDGRNYIVDPLGNSFFSLGIGYGSASRLGCYGFVDGMEEIHEWLPERDDETFADAYSQPNSNPEFVKRNGLVQGKDRVMFNFTIANFIRAFGKDWLNAWCVLLKGRMKKWGFNTIAIGVDDDTQESAKEYAKRLDMPYIYRMKLFPKTEKVIFRDFCDVYSEDYQARSKIFASQLEEFLDDENFMGFYMYNEPEWMAADHNINIAKLLLTTDNDTVTKDVVINLLKEKYGSIEVLNEKWGKNFADFDKMTDFEGGTDEMNSELNALNVMLIDKFFEVPAKECAKVTNGKAINFGFRCAGPWAASFGLGSKSCDAYSFNSYKVNPMGDLALAQTITDKPLIISEWHIGLATPQMFTPGLKGAQTQENRGIACRDYMLGAFSNPACIGVHYFEYTDMALLGRFDGANALIGFCDVCGLPYEKTMDIIAKGNSRMYDIVCGKDKVESFCDEEIGEYTW